MMFIEGVNDQKNKILSLYKKNKDKFSQSSIETETNSSHYRYYSTTKENQH